MVIFQRQMSLVVTSLYHIMLLAYYLIATYFVLGGTNKHVYGCVPLHEHGEQRVSGVLLYHSSHSFIGPGAMLGTSKKPQ